MFSIAQILQSEQPKTQDLPLISARGKGKLTLKGGTHMQVRSFLLTMGAGVAVGALGAMMLPKNSGVYKATKQAANAIKREAESAIDSLGSMQ